MYALRQHCLVGESKVWISVNFEAVFWFPYYFGKCKFDVWVMWWVGRERELCEHSQRKVRAVLHIMQWEMVDGTLQSYTCLLLHVMSYWFWQSLLSGGQIIVVKDGRILTVLFWAQTAKEPWNNLEEGNCMRFLSIDSKSHPVARKSKHLKAMNFHLKTATFSI